MSDEMEARAEVGRLKRDLSDVVFWMTILIAFAAVGGFLIGANYG
jgi:hypothetical protein